ncbi:hypothetical protein [Acinetobacter indicus]|uniref:hypothetical protein n=1 Tax=Acinetobacter indicus TaxID=756892 RepID=UPI001363EF1F|nr:hypothetical protein [Acinetobacter indicus]
MQKTIVALAFMMPSLVMAQTLEVYPKQLKSLKPVEIGSMILKFMPTEKSKVTWLTNANDSSIVWIDTPYQEHETRDGTPYTIRQGAFRGNVQGVKSTLLKDKLYEMPWAIKMNGGNSRHGVTDIEFYPAEVDLQSKETSMCFGNTHDKCTFSPFKSLTKSGIKYTKVCENKEVSFEYSIAYLLSAKGKKDVYAIWSYSSGSGGDYNSFTLHYSEDKKEVCSKLFP